MQEYLLKLNTDENIGVLKICEENQILSGDYCEYQDVKPATENNIQNIEEETEEIIDEESSQKSTVTGRKNKEMATVGSEKTDSNYYTIYYNPNGGVGPTKIQNIVDKYGFEIDLKKKKK